MKRRKTMISLSVIFALGLLCIILHWMGYPDYYQIHRLNRKIEAIIVPPAGTTRLQVDDMFGTPFREHYVSEDEMAQSPGSRGYQPKLGENHVEYHVLTDQFKHQPKVGLYVIFKNDIVIRATLNHRCVTGGKAAAIGILSKNILPTSEWKRQERARLQDEKHEALSVTQNLIQILYNQHTRHKTPTWN